MSDSVDTSLTVDAGSDALNGRAPASEHCAVDPASLDALGARDRDQLLIRHASGPVALFTVFELVDSPDPAVHVGTGGMARFGDPAPSTPAATIETCFTGGAGDVRLTETLRGADALGLAILAPHGGMIEPWTDAQADRVYEALAKRGKPVRAWIARGFNPAGAHPCWHITSTEISERSFPELGILFGSVGSYAHAVAFHGHGGTDILVGGGIVKGHRTFKDALRAGIESALAQIPDAPPAPAVVVATSGPLAGTSKRNVVNRITEHGNGIQIEQPFGVRRNAAQRNAIADAVAAFYAELV